MRVPRPIMRRLGWGPLENEGARLSPELRWMLRAFSLDRVDMNRVRPANQRDAYARLSASELAGPVIDVHTEEHRVPSEASIPIRVYRSHRLQKPAPLLCWLHGGGWVIGDLDTHDRFCRRIAEEAGIIVVGVDYRLAPEHPFPAAIEDAHAVWAWIRQHAESLGADPQRLALGGDSAGGNMTSVLCQELPANARPSLQVLCYAGADMKTRRESRKKFGDGFLLTGEMIAWFLKHYVGGVDRSLPRVSPIFGEIEAQPPAYVITAGLDPLLDEGLAYAEKLKEAGTPVDHHHEPAQVHGFITLFGALPGADRAVAEMVERLRRLLET